MSDFAFQPSLQGLEAALRQLLNSDRTDAGADPVLPITLPRNGIGEIATLELLAPLLLGSSAHRGAPTAFTHVDLPTPWRGGWGNLNRFDKWYFRSKSA